MEWVGACCHANDDWVLSSCVIQTMHENKKERVGEREREREKAREGGRERARERERGGGGREREGKRGREISLCRYGY